MPIRQGILFALFVAILPLHTTLWADIFPGVSVDEMCDKADVIIEGTYLDENDVRIDRIHKSSVLLKKESGTLEVSRLNEHSRTLWKGFRNDGKALETNRLILFLVQSKAGKWESMSTINDNGTCGSCGLFWFDDVMCYGYVQEMNPGPYVLLPAKDPQWRIPKTINALRADIETGLANSREWRRSLSLKDPAERALALARYLLKSTSPKGDKGTYLYATRQPIAALGKDAVPALIQVLRTAPADEKLDPAVLILYDIGPPAAQALPDLIPLLAKAERAFTGYVLIALGSTGDPRAVPYLEKYLESKDERLARDAKGALAVNRKRQSELADNTALARDMLSRMEKDFYHYESESRNIEKILSDCVFEQVDLDGGGAKERIVKVNWFSDEQPGTPKGYNYVRGAQDEGDFYIYAIRNRMPVFLGVIHGGTWKALRSTSGSFPDIETNSHWAWDESVINQYRYLDGQYQLVSSVLWRLSPDGKATERLRVFK